MTVSRDESSIARTYYESLRDEFERYAWEDDPAKPVARRLNPEKAEQLKAVREEFEQLDPLKGAKPSLGQLYKIELDLTSLIPEMALRTRYWAIENRFRRVCQRVCRTRFSSATTSAKSPTTRKTNCATWRARCSTRSTSSQRAFSRTPKSK